MINRLSSIARQYQELLFQLILHGLVFLFYSFDKRNTTIQLYQVAFFLTYAIANLFVGYYLLPRFYYKKKYLHFFLYVVVVIIGLMLVEELVLEQIFFPDTRGTRFPGVVFTLVQILPVMTILLGFKFAWDVIRKQQEVESLKTAVQESELQFLKTQINPHFLFNNLNNLYSYAIENSPKTPTIILELSSVLRYMLYDCREKYVSLHKEIEHLKNFTRLNELQIEERGTVYFNSQPFPRTYKIAPLILIVFIENAFKHSQASQSENIMIDIEIQVTEEGVLDFNCKNNYHKTTNTQHLSKGIGLENVKKRLELLYPNAYDLVISDENDLYEVSLRLKLQ